MNSVLVIVALISAVVVCASGAVIRPVDYDDEIGK